MKGKVISEIFGRLGNEMFEIAAAASFAKWNDKEYALDWMKTYSHPGAIYLLHGVNVANADALDEFITYMKSQGYRFDVVTNLK